MHASIGGALRGVLTLFASLVGGGLLAFLCQLVLARHLNVEEYGVFSSSLSVVLMSTAIAGAGIPNLWLQRFGAEGWEATRWIRPSMSVQLGLLVVVIGSLIVATIVSNYTPILVAATWMLPMAVAQVGVELLMSKCQLEGRYSAVAIWQVVPHLARLAAALGATLFLQVRDASQVAQSFALASVVVLLFVLLSWKFTLRDGLQLAGHGQRVGVGSSVCAPSLNEVISVAWPFAATAGLVMLYGRVEIVALGAMLGGEAAGFFSVASAFLVVAYLGPQAIFQKYLLPKLHRWWNQDVQRLVEVYRFSCGVMLLFGLVATLAVYSLAPIVVALFFGPRYTVAGELLSMLSVCVTLRFLSTSVGSVLVSRENVRRKMLCQLCVALTSVVVVTICVLFFGIFGAVISKILTEMLLMLLYLYLAAKYVVGSAALRWKVRLEV